jgi:inhibitor of cysteine peptidase
VSGLTLTDADDGRRLSVRVGDVVTLQLPESAAAGYRWTASGVDSAVVEVRRVGYEQAQGGVGSSGRAIWTLTAKSRGTVRVALEHTRPWESPAAATRSFTVTLAVDS